MIFRNAFAALPGRLTAGVVALVVLTAAAAGQGRLPTDVFAVLADLTENSLDAEEIRTLDDYQSIEFLRFDDLIPDSQREPLQDVLADTEDGFAEVQVAIRGNALLEAAFADEDVDVGQAIAMTGEEGGDLIVYLDEPAIPR